MGSDVESWFRQVDAAFRQIETPKELRLRLAETLFKEDAFDGWHTLRAERESWTYEEFRVAMMSEFCQENVQISRDIAFYTTSYDPDIPVAEVIQQFKRELLYCRRLCSDETALIRILSMRLDPAILLHLSTFEFPTWRAFARAVTAYDDQRRRSAAMFVPLRNGKHQRIESFTTPVILRPVAHAQHRTLVGVCYGCYKTGHVIGECRRTEIVCYGCRGRGHRQQFCPHGLGEVSVVVPPQIPQLQLRPIQGRGAIEHARGSAPRGVVPRGR